MALFIAEGESLIHLASIVIMKEVVLPRVFQTFQGTLGYTGNSSEVASFNNDICR